jgi:GTP-binding protein HflX
MIEHDGNDALRCVLVVSVTADQGREQAERLGEELAQLAQSAGIEPLRTIFAPLKRVDPRFFVGSGKADEVAELVVELELDLVVFDDDLSPIHQRNLERHLGCAVIDRHEVILDIFADRAQTREATLQVRLARLEYQLPRLRSAWTHLSRQRGGRRGTRGEGETQAETDRRMVLARIDRTKRELSQVSKQRATMRKQRSGVPVPTCALVGYTNAGKSSLLRALSGAEVLVANKLFATLDPTTRRVRLPEGTEVLFTDTVGFIRKLPHDLVEAFKSTLEETLLADILIHVVDGSSAEAAAQYRATMEVLEELDAADRQSIVVLNKVDQVSDPRFLFRPEVDVPCPAVSARTGEGLPQLLSLVEGKLATTLHQVRYSFPADRYDLVALVHRTGKVVAEEYINGSIHLNAEVPERTEKALAGFEL